ncbi:hypothetical protein J4G48_0015175 [Bradyrhizobium barranii subsp. apii]|uniref:hypothetical protein n=1 Tax=Bradyrhizobium barranii TaxID=2992140 RepID=UPI001AA197C8|nr:hypothetical protein [Bradyrhizobium barranii]UPT99306.1 hypothetical protein J4G48_0015175 [Bradyrhizobium barranii subsp. apii]
MNARCRYEGRHNRYAERGITICQKWQDSFDAFLADVGKKPTPAHSLDRFPDRGGNYEPGNVRWATTQQQADNKGNRIVVRLDGRHVFLKEAADILGITVPAAYGRYVAGQLVGTKLDSDTTLGAQR